jgi:putative hemolysin
MVAEIIIILVLILLNGIFSMSEIAIVSSRKSKLETDADEGDKKAKAALDIAESPTKFLSTVQIGITLIGVLTGVFGGGAISERLAAWLMQFDFISEYAEAVSLLIVVLIITYFSLVIGELVPKRIGLTNPEKIASYVAKPMNIISKITSPAVWLLSTSTENILKLLGIKAKESIVTEEEIKAMVREASDTGEVEKAEHEMVERVFFLGDTDAGSLMTSRVDVIFLDINDPFDVNKKIITDSIHTNFPVYENDPDNIIGILNLKTVVPSLLDLKEPDLRSLLKKPLFVPENTNSFDLLENLKNSHTHFAVVVDEYGGVKGIVTTNDVFKALVGNLYMSNQETEITRRDDGSHLVDALISLDEFFRYFEIEDTEEIRQQGFFTLGGLIMHISKSLPKAGEKFIWKNFCFEVLDMDGRRVDKVLVTKLSEEEE